MTFVVMDFGLLMIFVYQQGHDTTASSMTWTIYMLACHPEVQKKLQQEVDAVMGLAQQYLFD